MSPTCFRCGAAETIKWWVLHGRLACDKCAMGSVSIRPRGSGDMPRPAEPSDMRDLMKQGRKAQS